MSYTFRVIFDGVCALVPDYPFFPEKPIGDVRATELDVLLPDLTRAEYNTQPVEGLRVFRSPHFALLKFDVANLQRETTRRVDLFARAGDSPDEKGLIFLKREQIRICLKAENATSFQYSSWKPTNTSKLNDSWVSEEATPGLHFPEPAVQEQLESLWWLPRMQEIAPAYQKVRPGHLSTTLGPFPEELQARVEVKGGCLKTYDFNRDASGSPLPWRFLPASATPDTQGCWNRAIGNRQALEYYDVRGPVVLELKRLANEVHATELVLDQPRGVDSPDLEVVVTNREPESLFGVRDRLTAQLPDPDFEEFYLMHSDVQNAILQGESRPVPNPSGFGFLGIEDKPCSQVEMSRE